MNIILIMYKWVKKLFLVEHFLLLNWCIYFLSSRNPPFIHPIHLVNKVLTFCMLRYQTFLKVCFHVSIASLVFETRILNIWWIQSFFTFCSCKGILRMLYKVGGNIPGEHELCAIHIICMAIWKQPKIVNLESIIRVKYAHRKTDREYAWIKIIREL